MQTLFTLLSSDGSDCWTSLDGKKGNFFMLGLLSAWDLPPQSTPFSPTHHQTAGGVVGVTLAFRDASANRIVFVCWFSLFSREPRGRGSPMHPAPSSPVLQPAITTTNGVAGNINLRERNPLKGHDDHDNMNSFGWQMYVNLA